MNTIDVLMPVRNGGKHLVGAVRSTFSALGNDGRILVMNDGSTDSTAHDLRSLEREWGSRLIVLEHPTSLGVAASLNDLLDASTASMVARMDADDLCLPWRFRHQVRELARQRGLLFGGYVTFGSVKSLVKQPLPIALSAVAARAVVPFENPFCHPTLFAARATLKSIQGYRSGAAEDYLTWLAAIEGGIDARRTAAPVIMYRISAGQTSGATAWQRDAQREVEQSDAWQRLASRPPASRDVLSWSERVVVARARKRRGRL